MFRKILFTLFLFVVFSGVSCTEDFFEEEQDTYAPPMAKMAAAPYKAEETLADFGGEGERAVSEKIAQRKIIYTAEFRIEVEKYENGLSAVKKIVLDAGGFIADSTVDIDTSGAKSGKIRVRIPASKFNEVINGIKGIGKVKYAAEHGSDVTEEYTDLETRLSNSKRMEKRLLELLEKKTKNVKDLLDVEKELGRVRGDIERMEGRRRFLDDRLTLSTIVVSLYEPYTYTSSVFDPIKKAFNSAGKLLMKSLGGLITFLAVILPWVIIIGVFAWIVVKIIKRKLRKKKTEDKKD